ncbi:unnamed protein product [Knipowitschia caucasica]|uniref:Sacsin/Nov domain-containing protein n=1 Tax=Knipowitschia caucasica TaxID=637954 RepID=A0AAV2JV47_KNICA
MSAKAKKKHRGFGPTAPPFLDYLKDILRRYPDGGQILKELIQNADDANATEVRFIHDDRSYGTQSLCNQHLAKYQVLQLVQKSPWSDIDSYNIHHMHS